MAIICQKRYLTNVHLLQFHRCLTFINVLNLFELSEVGQVAPHDSQGFHELFVDFARLKRSKRRAPVN